VPADRLWGAQTQRSLAHFSIGKDLMPSEMITAYALLKKAVAVTNHAGKRLGDQQYTLIVQTCDEILAGQHHDIFPLHVWMTGSGTQFNTLAVLFKELDPSLNIAIYEVLGSAAQESSPACPVIVKPAPATPLCCMEFVRLIREAGLAEPWCQTFLTDDNGLAERLAIDRRWAFSVLSARRALVSTCAASWHLERAVRWSMAGPPRRSSIAAPNSTR
jgi:hypothetical protein